MAEKNMLVPFDKGTFDRTMVNELVVKLPSAAADSLTLAANIQSELYTYAARTTAEAASKVESATEKLCLAVGEIKKNYQPPKGKDKGNSPTYGDIAKSLGISPTYFSQLGNVYTLFFQGNGNTTEAAETFPVSNLIKFLPMYNAKESGSVSKVNTEIERALTVGELTTASTQKEIAEWVDTKITHKGAVEKKWRYFHWKLGVWEYAGETDAGEPLSPHESPFGSDVLEVCLKDVLKKKPYGMECTQAGAKGKWYRVITATDEGEIAMSFAVLETAEAMPRKPKLPDSLYVLLPTLSEEQKADLHNNYEFTDEDEAEDEAEEEYEGTIFDEDEDEADDE